MSSQNDRSPVSQSPSEPREAVKLALQESNTTQETLAIACDMELARLKAFLAGEGRVSRREWEKMRGALGLSVRQAKQGKK